MVSSFEIPEEGAALSLRIPRIKRNYDCGALLRCADVLFLTA